MTSVETELGRRWPWLPRWRLRRPLNRLRNRSGIRVIAGHIAPILDSLREDPWCTSDPVALDMALCSAIIVDVFAVESVNLARQVTWGCEKGIKHPVRSVKLRNNEKSGCSLKREK